MESESIVTMVIFVMAVVILGATYYGRFFLFVVSFSITIASSATADTILDFFGYSFSMGVVMFSFSYVITDILNELFDEKSAYRLALMNFLLQMVLLTFVFATSPLGAEVAQVSIGSPELHYLTTPHIASALLIATLGTLVNIWVYGKIKKVFYDGDRVWAGLWFRNNVSTFIGMTVSTVIFILISLLEFAPNPMDVIVAAFTVKVFVALIDTPILYLARVMRECKTATPLAPFTGRSP